MRRPNSSLALVLALTALLLPARGLGQSASTPLTTAEAYLKRGETRAGTHDFDAAIGDYNQALRLRPDYAEAYNDRGHSHYWKGEHALAIADFTRAIELRPDYPNAFNNRGATYMASGGNRASAIADFDQAIKLKPDFRNAYVNRANALLFRHWQRALADFHKAGMHPERRLAVVLLIVGAACFAILVRRRSARDRPLS